MKTWSDVLVSEDVSIFHAIEIIDRAALGIAVIIDSEHRLQGVVTDGDIRRAILKNLPMTSSVKDIMNKNPKFVFLGEEKANIMALMKKNSIKHIPILNQDHQVVGLEILESSLVKETKNNWVLIMAGGLGTRLRPLTNDCPKPLLKIDKKPVLQIILEGLIGSGFKKFFFSLNYRGDMIRNYFKDGSQWNVEIEYLEETTALGTAGAISLLPALPTAPFLVMNGDIMTRVNYQHLLDFHLSQGSAATVCVREYQHTVPYGVVKVSENQLLALEEKPVHQFFINAGIYVLEPDVFYGVKKDTHLNMPDLLTQLIEKNRPLSVFPVREYWSDIGRMEDYEKAHQDYQVYFA